MMRLSLSLLLVLALAGIQPLRAQDVAPTPSPSASASAAPRPSATATPKPSATPSPAPSPTASAAAKGAEGGFDWAKEVVGPLVRFGGIALILYLVILGLNLKDVLLPGAWSERTVIALAIVLTFCAVLLLNVEGQVLGVAKDVALIVIGFYFGASKGSQEERPVREVAAEKALRKDGG